MQYMLNDVLCNPGIYYTQMGILFVYIPYVYWKMVTYQNVTPELAGVEFGFMLWIHYLYPEQVVLHRLQCMLQVKLMSPQLHVNFRVTFVITTKWWIHRGFNCHV